MTESLLPPAFLFRFSVACRYSQDITSESLQLGPEHVIPSFSELDGRALFADVRVAWSEQGLAIRCRVVGKKQLPWCRDTRLDDSDGLQVLIDTRNAHNIHRASRFCHRFIFLPSGGGKKLDQPVAKMLDINRARETPADLGNLELPLKCKKAHDGYELFLQIPAAALTGFDPIDHPKLGFMYAIADRELGTQTFSVGPEFPILEDPSVWGTLDLVK